MIYTNVTVTINNNRTATSNNKVVLYRGDREVEIQITIEGNPFVVENNTYAQLLIRRPDATPIFSGIAPLQDSKVILTITEENIDELIETGPYTYQIRLYDEEMSSRVTLPPVENGLEIREPIADEASGVIGRAMIGYSLVSRASVSEDITFDENEEYNKTTWVDGDFITDIRMNKIEDALYTINQKALSSGATVGYISSALSSEQKVGIGESLNITFDFTSPNQGKGTLKVVVNDIEKISKYIDQEETTVNLPEEYFIKGSNKVVLYVIDRAGKLSNELIFNVRYGGTEITSDFDAYTAYDQGASVRYYFMPTALDTSSTLIFYMNIDGEVKEGVECTPEVRGYYTFPNDLSVGAHQCQAYLIDKNGEQSNILKFNLIIIDSESIVVSSDTNNPVIEEGAQLTLDYKVYSKFKTSFTTKIYIDNVLVDTSTCGLETSYYKTSSLTEGIHSIKLEVTDTKETTSNYIIWTVTVTESTFEKIQPSNSGALFIASAFNHSNSDSNKETWIGVNQDGDEITSNLSNFSFNSENGWVDDELIISGVSSVEIPIAPLANNAKYGFTLDIEFTSKAIGIEDALVLDLWDYDKKCGVKITTEQVIIRSAEGNEQALYFEDNANTSVIFVIDRDEAKAKIYLNGVMCGGFHLSDYILNNQRILEDFSVSSNVKLGGSGYCKIRNIRIYEIALTTNEILNNFIANKNSKDEQKELIKFQNGDELPTLTIYCDFSGLGKNDKKPCKIVYSSTNEEKYGKSFTLDHKKSQLQYQGTSSMAYPIKNYRLNLRDENGDKLYYDFPFGKSECRFTLKADFMSSGHWQNTGLTKWINDNLYNYQPDDEKSMNPKKWFDLQNGGKITDTRECIYGFPCRLILVNDGTTPLNEGQNEPTPGNTKDMGIFNFNNDKDNVTTMGFDLENFPNCMGFEVAANSDTSAGAFMSYDANKHDISELEYLQQSFELRCPDDPFNDWYGYLGINLGTLVTDYYQEGLEYSTTYWKWNKTSINFSSDATLTKIECFKDNILLAPVSIKKTEGVVTLIDGTNRIRLIFESIPNVFYINDQKYLFGNMLDSSIMKDPYLGDEINPNYGLKRLIDWVDKSTDEEFIRDFENYFHKDYTLRYYLLVITLGMVDNLGKNMMLDSWDGQIWMPRFYDCDTICSYDNSGDIKFDVDIEMEQGYWNTSSSRLWTRIRDLMHSDLVAKYNDMRQNGLSYESLMNYFYGEQISKIPQKYYNMDYDVKYAPFADSYMSMAHGDGYEHLKRWLKNRLIFTDSLFDYAPGYNNDVLTIRANTTELMTLQIETYTPVYQHLSWYNGQMDKKKINANESVGFSGYAMAATDQEVLIYGGSNIKRITGISSLNPNQMLIGSATRIMDLDASLSPLLSDINANKANLLPHIYLNSVKLNDCPLLGGYLRVDKSPLIREINIKNTSINGVVLPSSIRNLEKLQLSDNIIDLTLNDAVSLKELALPSSLESFTLRNAVSLQSVGVESLETLHTLYIENPKFNPFSIINNAPNLEYINLTNIDCAADSSKMRALGNLKGINLEGEEIPISEAITGKVTLGTCTTGTETYLKSTFPNVKFTIINYIPGFTVKFHDGDNNLIYTTEVESGGEAVYEGPTPTKTSTSQYDYVFTGWNAPLGPITANCIIRAEFESVTRSYKVTFRYPSLEIIEEQTCIYGSMPVPPETTLQYDGWEPALSRVYGEQIYTAKAVEMPEDMSIFSFEEVTIGDVTGYECTFNYSSSTCPSRLVFPIVYNGINVISIAGSSSSHKSQISSVYIPKTVIRFGQNAFARMDHLYEIDQEAISRVVELGSHCFFNLSGSRMTFKFSDKITSFPTDCFYGCKTTTVYIPSHIHELSEGCFAQSSAIIYGIEHITRFGEKALYNFKGTIKNYELFDPSKVESIDSMAFYNTSYKTTYTNQLFSGEITFSNLTNLKANALGFNTAMTDISFPKLTSVCGDFMSVYDITTNVPKLRRITFGSSEYPVEHITSTGFIYYNGSSSGGAYKPLIINVITSDGTSTSLETNNLNSLSSSSYAVTTSLSQANLVFSDSPVDFYFDDNNIGYIVFDDHAECSGQLAGTSGIGELILPQYINGVPLTTIRNYAFCYNTGLTSVKAPHITKLSRCYSFSFCSSLTKVEFDSVSKLNEYSPLSTNYSMPFYQCKVLTYARFGSSSVPFTAYSNSTSYSNFEECSSLVIINLITLNGLKSDVVFTGTTGRSYENLIVYSISPVTYETYYDSEHLSTYAIINGEAKLIYVSTLVTSWAPPTDVDWVVTDLVKGFSGCSKLTTVTIPETVTTLPEGCFYNCTSLTTINDLSHITLVKGRAFLKASKLTYIKIGATMFADVSGYGNFEGCSSLEEVWFSGSVTALGDQYLFANCNNITTITLGSVGNPITSISIPTTSVFRSTLKYINIYVEDPNNPPSINRLPGGATNATITYLQA